MRKLLFALLFVTLSMSMASATTTGNLFQGWTVTGTNNAFVANATMLVFLPGTAKVVTPDNDPGNPQNISPQFQMTFTAPGTYVIGAFDLWELAEGSPFTIGTTISNTFFPKIGGQTCVPAVPCTVVVPSGTSLTKPYVILTDPFLDTYIDVHHNWVLAIYFASNTSSGAAVAQGIGSETVTGALNAATGNQVTGETSLPLGRDGSTRIFLFTGVQY